MFDIFTIDIMNKVAEAQYGFNGTVKTDLLGFLYHIFNMGNASDGMVNILNITPKSYTLVYILLLVGFALITLFVSKKIFSSIYNNKFRDFEINSFKKYLLNPNNWNNIISYCGEEPIYLTNIKEKFKEKERLENEKKEENNLFASPFTYNIAFSPVAKNCYEFYHKLDDILCGIKYIGHENYYLEMFDTTDYEEIHRVNDDIRPDVIFTNRGIIIVDFLAAGNAISAFYGEPIPNNSKYNKFIKKCNIDESDFAENVFFYREKKEYNYKLLDVRYLPKKYEHMKYFKAGARRLGLELSSTGDCSIPVYFLYVMDNNSTRYCDKELSENVFLVSPNEAKTLIENLPIIDLFRTIETPVFKTLLEQITKVYFKEIMMDIIIESENGDFDFDDYEEYEYTNNQEIQSYDNDYYDEEYRAEVLEEIKLNPSDEKKIINRELLKYHDTPDCDVDEETRLKRDRTIVDIKQKLKENTPQ